MRPESCSGYSLVESMVSLLILGVGIFSYIDLDKHLIQANRLASERTTAANLLNHKVAFLRSQKLSEQEQGQEIIETENVNYTLSWEKLATVEGTRIESQIKWENKDETLQLLLAGVYPAPPLLSTHEGQPVVRLTTLD